MSNVQQNMRETVRWLPCRSAEGHLLESFSAVQPVGVEWFGGRWVIKVRPLVRAKNSDSQRICFLGAHSVGNDNGQERFGLCTFDLPAVVRYGPKYYPFLTDVEPLPRVGDLLYFGEYLNETDLSVPGGELHHGSSAQKLLPDDSLSGVTAARFQLQVLGLLSEWGATEDAVRAGEIGLILVGQAVENRALFTVRFGNFDVAGGAAVPFSPLYEGLNVTATSDSLKFSVNGMYHVAFHATIYGGSGVARGTQLALEAYRRRTVGESVTEAGLDIWAGRNKDNAAGVDYGVTAENISTSGLAWFQEDDELRIKNTSGATAGMHVVSLNVTVWRM